MGLFKKPKFFEKKNKTSAPEEAAMAKAMSADASEYYFAGLAVTSIAVKSKEGDENKVTFSEADPNGEEGVFLKNFKLISDESVEEGKTLNTSFANENSSMNSSSISHFIYDCYQRKERI